MPPAPFLRMKYLFSGEHGHGVGLLAAGNLSLSAIDSVLARAEPLMHLLVALGQTSVAVATVWYIVRKTSLLRGASAQKKKGRRKTR